MAWNWPNLNIIRNFRFDKEDQSVKFLKDKAPFCCKDGDLISVRLDMDERTVSFELNGEFVVRMRNLNPNASFRLAVTIRIIGDSVEIMDSFFE